MSLLNDALKAAEQRQQSSAPSAYTGQGQAAARRRSPVVPAILGVGLIVLVGVGAYLYLGPSTPVAATAIPDAGEASLTTSPPSGQAATAPASDTEQPVVAGSAGNHTPEPAVATVKEALPERIESAASSSAQPEATQSPATAAPQPVTAETKSEPEASDVPAVASQAEPTVAAKPAVETPSVEPAETSPVSQPAEPVEAQAAPADPAAKQASTGEFAVSPASTSVKQPRQTPSQRDLAASKSIRSLVREGEVTAAEQALARLTENQAAPQSRYAFARGVLARGDANRALAWVPADLAARHADLRLIRARAILATGDLEQAVTTLQSTIPPVADHVEYRVTLATLLQQQGYSDQAATHWAELIAWDNSQAPWWVGLAIALEGRGDLPAARRAYQQAAALPGLAPSLADYVRQRLQILGAG